MIAEFYYYLFLALGLVVSYEDWSQRRVRNSWIVLGLLAGAAGLAFLLWNSILGHQGVRLGRIGEHYMPWRYYSKMLIHMALSFTAAFTMWRLAIWPAGDAKLFTLFAFLVALINPNIPGYPLLLFMLLLVNIFVPAGLVFAAETVGHLLLRTSGLRRIDWKVWLKAKADVIEVRVREAWPYRYQYLTLVVNLYALFYLTGTSQRYSQKLAWGPFGNVVLFLLMFVAWGKITMVLRDRRVGYLALACIAAAMSGGAVYGHWDILAIIVRALKMTFNFGVFLSVARLVFHWYIELESLRELKPEHLQPGVVLSDETWRTLQKDQDLSEKLGGRFSDGLTQDEVDALKTWLASRPAPAEYTFYQTIPFALWIFLGSLYTVARRGNLVSLLIPYGERAWDLFKSGAARALS
ncbi:MAG: hypothetical protein NTY77_17600 [Elusimicrobia bacterium]|nr:hypothetical protein [Elusimicrobiota bacterium]